MLIDPPFKLIDIDDHHAKASAFDMLLIVWKKETQASAYMRLITLITEMGERHPEGIGVLQVVETSASPPDEAARKVFLQALGVCDKYVKHHSVVHEGSGFKAASVRAIVMGVYMVHQPKFEHLVANSLLRAAQWHEAEQRKLGKTQGAEQIVRSVEMIRYLLARRP
jgi:hypothetical protein